jgi:hypothetical protein
LLLAGKRWLQQENEGIGGKNKIHPIMVIIANTVPVGITAVITALIALFPLFILLAIQKWSKFSRIKKDKI